jgi:hypothetical protein
VSKTNLIQIYMISSKTPLVATLSGFLAISLIASADAGVVFSESFEAPVVSGYSNNSIPSGGKWIGATAGFGATNRGLYNESVIWPATPPFSTPFGAQAYYLNYTNSGLTTAVGATGQTLTAGVTYKVSFNAGVPAGTASGTYLVELVAFATADNNTARANCQSTRSGAVLATASGTVTTNTMSGSGQLVFTPAVGNTHLGKDLGIRLIKATNNVLYDNIRLVTGHDMNPTPASGVTIAGGNVSLNWTNMPPTSGVNVAVDVWFGTNSAALTKVVTGGLNTSSTIVSAPGANTYYWRVDSYPDGNPAGTPVTGDLFVFIVNDTDNDGFPDSYELANTNPSSNTALNPGDDIDTDGLTNLQEFQFNTLPNDNDTDNDTLLDGAEITGVAPRPATNPRLADTDSDGLSDGAENNSGIWVSVSNTGTSPTDADKDNDGLKDGVETKTGTFVSRTANTGTDPYLADTDNDGAGDWYEVAATFTNPNSNAETSPIPYPLPDPVSTDLGNPAKPVKVYIMSGQSNMVGIGYVNGGAGSLDTITKQENKFPNFVNASNAYTKRNDVIYKGVVTATAQGPLTAGQGSESTRVGVELGFGHVMGWFHDEPVLLLKASEGNRSLGWDFAPPDTTRFDLAGQTYPAYGESPLKWTTGTTPVPINWYAGLQYDQCFRNEAAWPPAGASNASIINAYDILKNGVLQNLPTTDNNLNGRSYQIAGFVWWQGHKDQYDAGHYTRYEANLARLIPALRAEFNAPSAPFVVATIGFDGGNYALNSPYDYIYKAQKAISDPVKHPTFVGNVKSVDTTGYWRTTGESPGAQGFHYNNNAETYTLVGDALGRAMLDLLDDTDPPLPNPPTFATAPTPINVTTVGMVATTASDVSGPVEYWFENITNGNNSGWITSTTWQNTGLSNGVSYDFRFKARDSKSNQTGWSAVAAAAPGLDVNAPLPNPMSFATLPTALGENSVTMTATAANDINGVQYEFICTVGGGPNSGLQNGITFVATGLTPGATYTYTVRARDAIGNVTAASAAASATTTAPDTTAPTPNPITFATPPTAQGQTTITMTATTATDPSGVEYYFNCLSLGGDDSGWQNSPVYTDSGLTPNTEYTYQVQVRDKSPAQNTGAASVQASATTETPDITPPVILSVSPADNATGVSVSSNLVATFDEVINPNTGSIIIKNLSDATQTVINVTDSTQIIISGSVLTINPSANLASGKNFAVQISAAAFEDDAGNSFSGISTDSAWSFETPIVQPPTGIALAGFETSLSPWIPNSIASTGRYSSAAPKLLQPTDDTTTNFAATGNGAASIGKAGGEIVSPALDLSAGGTNENLTLSLSFVLHNGSSTRRSFIDYSRDGGTNWFTIAMMQIGAAGAASNKTIYSGTVRITEGSSTVTRTGNLDAVNLTGHAPWAGAAFTNNSKLRIRNLGSASADVRLFVDNLAVTTSIAAPPSDTVRPTLTSITDDKSGGPISIGTPVIYTVSFSEDIAASGVTAADFGNAGTASVTIGSLTETTSTSGVFLVQATPSSAGTLRLQINPDSLVEDMAANDLVTTTALLDDTIITVGSGDPYAAWSASAPFDADSNNDGLDNGMAWLLGAANKDANASNKLPTASQANGSLTLTFSCLNAASRGNTALQIQHSGNIGQGDPWASIAVPETTSTVAGVAFTVTPNGTSNHILATIPIAEAQAGELFARLRAVSNP